MPEPRPVNRRSARERISDALHRGAELSYDDLKEIADCEERHCRRIITSLIEEGEPIESRRNGKQKLYYIPEEHRELGFRVRLSADEMLALTIAADASLAALGPTPLGRSLGSAIRQLTEEIDGEFYHLDPEEESTEHYHFNATPSANIDPEIFRLLQGAMRECETVEVVYFTASRMEESARQLDPYAFAAPGGSWMLLAWCRLRRDFRTFSLADIRSVRLTGSHFIREEIDIPRYFRDNLGGVGGGEIHDVLLHVAPDCVPSFRRKRYHSSQQLVPHQDGSAQVGFRVAGLQDIRAFVMSFGHGITVLSPSPLIDIIRQEARNLVRIYDEEGETEAHGDI